jgi:hypothetical protein
MPDGTPSTTFIGRNDQILTFLQVARHVNPAHRPFEPLAGPSKQRFIGNKTIGELYAGKAH